MNPCNGRCSCHAASWDVMDKAAGIKRRPHAGGRKPFETDRGRFERKLRVAYMAVWETEGFDPNRRPSLRRVAEHEQIACDRRTLRRACTRLGVVWPPIALLNEAA